LCGVHPRGASSLFASARAGITITDMVLSPRPLLMLGPALARFLGPSPARLARWRSQLKDIFHVDEVPFWSVGGVLCLLGAVEITYVKPIREKEERSHRLQEFVTRSRLEGFDAAVKA
jgi:hypothetical protein